MAFLNRIIEYSFYVLFFFVPLFFLGNTSELFELNKMWLTFALAVVIGAVWFMKMIAERKILIRRTPLDIPIILFLISQIISSIFSLDPHVSFWGFYSRFNGGLLSFITYILLYYAFVSNLELIHVLRSIKISLISCVITALWGLPSHFGYDPTCLLFRGELNTNCWTDAFRPTIRVFSTLGQPAWFAAYLDVLLPISIAYVLITAKEKKKNTMAVFLAITLLFYICLMFANTRAGTLGFFVTDIILWVILFARKIFNFKKTLKYFLIIHLGFALCNFLFGAPIGSLDKYTLPQLQKKFTANAQRLKADITKKNVIKITGITDSAQIRLIVWKGAINAWKASPIFGTGVETFAYAYYLHRPAEHNMTSEWDYLYNKAHNEYLNYLTTTGIIGLASYLSIIFVFLYVTFKAIMSKKERGHSELILIIALFASFLTILITNFFGFSVVIINLFLFFIPIFVFFSIGKINADNNYEMDFGTYNKKHKVSMNSFQWILISIFFILALYFLIGLFRYWYADTLYALGANLDRSANYQQATKLLQDAVDLEPSEPIYKDELAVNLATIATALYMQKDTTLAEQVADSAIALNNDVIEGHPNNLVFWKNRLRVFYSLASANTKNKGEYIQQSISALKKSIELAPTDAKIYYNLGILYGQTGKEQEGIDLLEKTIRLKPDYVDAYSALGLLYNQSYQKSHSQQLNQKAIETYQFILDNFSPDNTQIKKTLEEWKKG